MLRQRVDIAEITHILDALPIGEAFHRHMQRYPDIWQGGYQRTPGRYHYDSVPSGESYKRIALRSGFEPQDEYVVMDGSDQLPVEPLTLNAPYPCTRSGFFKVTFLVKAKEG